MHVDIKIYIHVYMYIRHLYTAHYKHRTNRLSTRQVCPCIRICRYICVNTYTWGHTDIYTCIRGKNDIHICIHLYMHHIYICISLYVLMYMYLCECMYLCLRGHIYIFIQVHVPEDIKIYMYVHVEICIHICISTCIYICIHVYMSKMYVYMYSCIHAHTSPSQRWRMRTWKDVHTYIHVQTCIHAHVYICVHVQTYIHAHTSDVHTCAYVTYIYIFSRCRHAYMRIRHLYVTFTQRIADIRLMDLAPDKYVHVYT